MYTIQVELQRDKYLIFITDNENLVKLIQKKDFILQQHEHSFSATIIDMDFDGYRKSLHIDNWLNSIIKSRVVGRFILAQQYMNKDKLYGGQVFVNGNYKEVEKKEILYLLRNMSYRTLKNAKKLSIKIGRIKIIYEDIIQNGSPTEVIENDEVPPEIELAEKEYKSEEPQKKVDKLYDKAAELIINNQIASVSYLQRKLHIGYARSRAFDGHFRGKWNRWAV